MANIFDKGEGDWEKLYTFMDENEFSCGDFCACICANLLRNPDKDFYTRIMVGGQEFEINGL